MVLDTSHDCWHGPYSAFRAWRCELNMLIAADREGSSIEWRHVRYMGNTREGLQLAWRLGLYDDQTDPLNVLMNHSDCDGWIAADVCGPMADALQSLMDRRMPARAMYDTARPATERFIAGLRKAAAAGEPVRFA